MKFDVQLAWTSCGLELDVTVEKAILDSFGKVLGFDALSLGQIGNGTRKFQKLIMSPGG